MSVARDGIVRRRVRTTLGGVALLSCLLVTGCTSAPEPTTAGPAPSASSASSAASSAPATPSTSSSPEPSAEGVVVDITIADGKVTPNGQKLSVKVGEQVTLNVTSDENDEIHAHTGGDGYELEVPAGKPTTGSFTLTSAGSFEVESHHLEKIIVILNAS